ncbi:hypothetical protein [Rhodoplanes roseus]|uniref:Uncharacterized protein n=1 Tax=Rhodoplanes roseus TaxID=29409 RepID=A0A327L5B0_9BRAD|nr:hypothetical protein [Rhodoplanes roseus]RAI44742.1 hypothetical protein CH341_07560 [Rhodoplanes roseus]
MLRSKPALVSPGRIVVVAAGLVIGLATVSTPAEARRIRIPLFRSSSVATPPPAAVRTAPTQSRGVFYVSSGSRPFAPTRTSAASEGDLGRLAGPDVASLSATAALAGEKTQADEKNARRKAWLDFCQPKLAPPDRYGVEYYVYAHPGCQFGRTE